MHEATLLPSMPTLSRLFIKTALGYLSIGLLLGIFLSLPLQGAGQTWQPLLWPVWIHLLTVGWLTQLIFGVAFWLFPRYSREQPYGPAFLAAWSYYLLNAGLLLRGASEPMVLYTAQLPWRYLLLLSALLQATGGILMVIYLWTRTRPR